MHRRCQDRIRSYLYKTIDQIKASDTWSSNRQARLHLDRIIEYFKMQLKEDHYFGYYFDRSRGNINDLNNTDDKIDGPEDDCYEHCPCKLRRVEIKDNLIGNGVDSPADETDAKRLSTSRDSSSTKRLTVDEKESCLYSIFPRGKTDQHALCDALGEFRCEGVWNANNCAYGDRHRINPYRSHEELVLFSTWNLDHK